MINTSYKDIKNHLSNDLNLKSNDVVFLFSGIWGLGKIENNDIDIVVEAFKNILNEGILIVPTFSYSWNNKKNWLIDEVNCNDMGAISCNTINKDGFFRTDHPNFSVNIYKNNFNRTQVDDFLDIDNNTFGINSIFGKLYNYSRNNRAFVLLFGGAFDDVLYRSTFIHFAQQKIGVLHRFLKKVYDPQNNKFVLQYSRYLDKKEVSDQKVLNNFNFPIEEDFSNYGEDLKRENKIIIKNFKYYPSRMVNIFDSVNLMISKYDKNKYYCISENSIKK